MYVFEPKQSPDGWQMVARALQGDKLPVVVTPTYPTSDQCRTDARARKWCRYVESHGEHGMDILRWAAAKVAADAALEMGLPDEVVPAYHAEAQPVRAEKPANSKRK